MENLWLQNTAVCLNIPEAGILSAPSAAMLVALVAGTWIPAFLVGTDELSHTAWVRLEFLPVGDSL